MPDSGTVGAIFWCKVGACANWVPHSGANWVPLSGAKWVLGATGCWVPVGAGCQWELGASGRWVPVQKFLFYPSKAWIPFINAPVCSVNELPGEK